MQVSEMPVSQKVQRQKVQRHVFQKFNFSIVLCEWPSIAGQWLYCCSVRLIVQKVFFLLTRWGCSQNAFFYSSVLLFHVNMCQIDVFDHCICVLHLAQGTTFLNRTLPATLVFSKQKFVLCECPLMDYKIINR